MGDGHIDNAVILAAGRGKRLNKITKNIPKCLIEIKDKPIIFHNLEILEKNGVKNVAIVVGYMARKVIEKIRSGNFKMNIMFVLNKEWEKTDNLYSLWCAKNIYTKFLLMMSDHLFSPKVIEKMLNLDFDDKILKIGVEKKWPGFEDCKVRIKRDLIVKIGKKLLSRYVDTGIFICKSDIYKYVEAALKKGRSKWSECIQIMAKDKKVGYYLINELRKKRKEILWCDIDTEKDLKRAQKFLLT